jgi:tetratricopeptide (TPR) repeat protein
MNPFNRIRHLLGYHGETWEDYSMRQGSKVNGKTPNPGLDPLLDIIDHQMARTIVLLGRACDQAEQLLAEGDFTEVLNLVLPVIQAGGTAERAKRIAGTALQELADQGHDYGNLEDELRYLELWSAIDPDALYPLIRRAEILWLEMDNGSEAYRVYRQAAKRHSCSIEAWLGLAQIDLAYNHVYRAVRHLKKAWGCLRDAEWGYTPTAEIVVNVLETLYVLTARVCTALGDRKLAEQVLMQGLQIMDDHSVYISEYLKDLRENR